MRRTPTIVVDDADVERAAFQHDALLDMQFEIGADIAAFGLGKPVRIAADAA